MLYKEEISLIEKEQKIIDLLNDAEFLAAKEIRMALGVKKTQTNNYLQRLLAKGLIAKIGNGRNVKYMLKEKQHRIQY